MRARISFSKSLVIGAFALVPGMLLGGSALAQDATPASTPLGPSEGYPVAIHQGSCDDLTAEPSFEIANAVTVGVGGEGEVETVGGSEGAPIITDATATVDSSLNDIAEQGSAVAVHASEDEYDTIVACGNVAGIKEEGKVVIPINSGENSTVVGVAILEEDGDDKTNVTVYLFDTRDEQAATPAA
jgi:hypothetical protein